MYVSPTKTVVAIISLDYAGDHWGSGGSRYRAHHRSDRSGRVGTQLTTVSPILTLTRHAWPETREWLLDVPVVVT